MTNPVDGLGSSSRTYDRLDSMDAPSPLTLVDIENAASLPAPGNLNIQPVNGIGGLAPPKISVDYDHES